MRGSKNETRKPAEGLRERKRRQTRERIAQAAMTLFLEQGFDATTIDQIADAADVSKRGFFDYFPAKEDVVAAWQDEFADSLLEEVASRPTKEPMAKTVEEALISTIVAAVNPQTLALGKLIKNTPALRARDHLKYAKLEQKLVEALTARAKGKADQLRIRLLAMSAIGALRVAGQTWDLDQFLNKPPAHIRKIAKTLWSTLGELGAEGKGK
ncbi:TetR family transcriptional regulator [Bradyrhizobium sp. G127]|jgi:AcrR family transcriptional regulator|uniref:TetR family transcriptional regulator n=1 Tax=Bradyrhizobium sp. G127 TaxID=2904800 RepID=UPI001F2C2BDB|nr:TetR family transcriptional regulator [Bradyrhizobium sp. G127]MCF2525069.1 TetR/AcrR family transcriptional regulator [Bradyrhizobium sp. G127]